MVRQLIWFERCILEQLLWLKSITLSRSVALCSSVESIYVSTKFSEKVYIIDKSKARYTLSVMCDSFTEHTLVKCETTSSIHEIVI